jgi:hypothetical protein
MPNLQKSVKLLYLSFLLINTTLSLGQDIDYLKLSENLLTNIKNDASPEKQINILENSSLENLTSQLKNDDQKKPSGLIFTMHLYRFHLKKIQSNLVKVTGAIFLVHHVLTSQVKNYPLMTLNMV